MYRRIPIDEGLPSLLHQPQGQLPVLIVLNEQPRTEQGVLVPGAWYNLFVEQQEEGDSIIQPVHLVAANPTSVLDSGTAGHSYWAAA